MKLRVKDTNETLPVAQDSFICGLRPDGNEVEFLVEDVELISDDWSSFRRDAAKDILCSIIQMGAIDSWKNIVPSAIKGADELIKQLKENEKS